MAIREGVVNGSWMAGSKIDNEHWANANARLKRNRDEEFDSFLNQQKTSTGIFAPNFDSNFFKSFINNRIMGEGEPTDKLQIAGQERFKQFLNPAPVISNNPMANPMSSTNSIIGTTKQISKPTPQRGRNTYGGNYLFGPSKFNFKKF